MLRNQMMWHPGLPQIARAVLLGFALLAGTMAARAEERADSFVPGEVLVAFRPEIPAWQREVAVRSLDARVVPRSTALGHEKLALPVDLSVEEAVRRLSADPRVLWAEPNYLQQALDGLSPQDPYLNDEPAPAENQWGVFTTGVYSLWRQVTEGQQCGTVAIVDSGIWNYVTAHPDLAANLLNGANDGFDYVDDDAVPQDAGANAGHGTNVAGVVAAAANQQGIAGIAPCAKFRVIRVLDCGWGGAGCAGSVDDIAAGIRFAADKGSDVINLSLGGWSYSQAQRNAVLYAIEKGCIVVAASGNDTASEIRYPARFPEVIAVGASGRRDQVASFSNWGTNLDVVAPGDSIWTTRGASSYEQVPGTSFAAPFVSGVCALLGHRNPAIKQHEAEAWIRRQGVSIDAEKDGHGRVDYRKLEDWSDSPAHAPGSHRNAFWEWLGAEATHEKGMADPLDDDGKPNAALDGADDGVFPGSASKLPIVPPHLGPSSLLYSLSVGDAAGLRYGAEAAKNLYVDGWADWNSNGTLVPMGSFAENPAGWPDDAEVVESGIAVLDEHILGNPLMLRTRLSYGEPAGTPAGAADFGEVEDDILINMVEDFDVGLHGVNPGVWFAMDGWGIVSDPDPPFFTNHGSWHMAKGAHPPAFACTGAIERLGIMRTPSMDWREYTKAYLSFVYCHSFTPCPPGTPPDHCNVQIIRDGMPVETIVMPVGAGTMVKDLSAHVGSGAVEIHFIVETDWPGLFYVDDVMVWAYDDSSPAAVANLAATRTAGQPVLRLDWTDPEENGPGTPPPSQKTAETYSLRYSASPIGSEEDWLRALPWTPFDLSGGGGFPGPGVPGSPNTGQFQVPSAHQAYHAALRTGDEVVNVSATSNVPLEATLPTLAVTVTAGPPVFAAAPGDTIEIEFLVTNTGNTPEQFKVETSEVRGWDHGFLELEPLTPAIGILLDPNTSAPLTARAVVAGGAQDGEVDSLTVRAVSLSSGGSVTASASQTITVDAPSGASVAEIAAVPSLRLSGPNPFSDDTEIRLVLSRPQPWEARVYDVRGRLVRSLGRGSLEAGAHAIPWDGRDDRGSVVPAGVYSMKVRTQEAGGVLRLVKLR
jgi:hypothetical protein